MVTLRALLITAESGMNSEKLNKEYIEQVGEQIPFNEFGFSSLNQFLLSIDGSIRSEFNIIGERVFFPIIDDNTRKYVPEKKPSESKSTHSTSSSDINQLNPSLNTSVAKSSNDSLSRSSHHHSSTDTQSNHRCSRECFSRRAQLPRPANLKSFSRHHSRSRRKRQRASRSRSSSRRRDLPSSCFDKHCNSNSRRRSRSHSRSHDQHRSKELVIPPATEEPKKVMVSCETQTDLDTTGKSGDDPSGSSKKEMESVGTQTDSDTLSATYKPLNKLLDTCELLVNDWECIKVKSQEKKESIVKEDETSQSSTTRRIVSNPASSHKKTSCSTSGPSILGEIIRGCECRRKVKSKWLRKNFITCSAERRNCGASPLQVSSQNPFLTGNITDEEAKLLPWPVETKIPFFARFSREQKLRIITSLKKGSLVPLSIHNLSLIFERAPSGLSLIHI